MKFLEKISPEWALRLGLGLMFVYSSIDILRHPSAWFWAVRPIFKWFPVAMQSSLNKPEAMTSFLRGHAVWELLLVFLLLGWFLPKKFVKWGALFSTLEMAGILLLIPIDAITFRDIGLLGAGAALFLLLNRGDAGVETPVKPSAAVPGQTSVQTFDQFMKS